MSRSNSSTAANDDSFHASSSTTDESIVASSTINADNSESTDFQSVTFEVSDDLKDRVDKLSSAYNSTLPLISQSLTGMAKLGKNTAITQLVTLAPTIEFVKPNVAQFARFYLYWKTELSTLDTHGEALKSCFEIFEKHDVDQMKEVDADTLAILAKAIHLSTKDSPGKGKLFYELGYVNTPPIFGLLEEIHSFHCGARSYPVSVERVINVIKYGSTYDNIGAVRIHLSFLECVKLFHPVKDDIPESKKASNFL